MLTGPDTVGLGEGTAVLVGGRTGLGLVTRLGDPVGASVDEAVAGGVGVVRLDGRGELPVGAVSLHPASAVNTTSAPTSLTLRR